MLEIVYDDDGRRTAHGRRLDGYTISSPCEPNGSGELKKRGGGLEIEGALVLFSVIHLVVLMVYTKFESKMYAKIRN